MTKTQKRKVLNAMLIFSSLIGYLEWAGGTYHLFLFQGEADVLVKLFTDPQSAAHPFTLLPLAGQLALLVTIFQKEPGKILTYLGMAGIGLLLLFILFIGIMELNLKMTLSCLPFVILSILIIRENRKDRKRA